CAERSGDQRPNQNAIRQYAVHNKRTSPVRARREPRGTWVPRRSLGTSFFLTFAASRRWNLRQPDRLQRLRAILVEQEEGVLIADLFELPDAFEVLQRLGRQA